MNMKTPPFAASSTTLHRPANVSSSLAKCLRKICVSTSSRVRPFGKRKAHISAKWPTRKPLTSWAVKSPLIRLAHANRRWRRVCSSEELNNSLAALEQTSSCWRGRGGEKWNGNEWRKIEHTEQSRYGINRVHQRFFSISNHFRFSRNYKKKINIIFSRSRKPLGTKNSWA